MPSKSNEHIEKTKLLGRLLYGCRDLFGSFHLSSKLAMNVKVSSTGPLALSIQSLERAILIERLNSYYWYTT